MILKFVFLLLLCQRECSKIPTVGRITITNKITNVIRVTLAPAVNWNYYETRTNQTISKNPEKLVGGNYVT